MVCQVLWCLLLNAASTLAGTAAAKTKSCGLKHAVLIISGRFSLHRKRELGHRANARALTKLTSTRLPTMLGTEPIAVSEYALFHGTSVHGIGAVVRDYLCRLLAGDSCAVASVVFAASVSVCARCACMFHNASSRACAHLRAHLFTLVFNIGACGRPCHRPMLRIHRQMHF